MDHTWHDLTPDARRRLPPRLRPWISLDSSMTARIGQAAGRPIGVTVLRQVGGRLLPDERKFFPDADGPVTVREVCLGADGRPLLAARTVFTSRRLREHPTIVGLGTRPLGSLLFAGGRVSPYSAREFASLGGPAPLAALARRCDGGVREGYWARRTLFRLFGEPLLVTEVFLPDLVHRPAAD